MKPAAPNSINEKVSIKAKPTCFLRYFIGNMGNPTITRLGKTQMWYKKYYTDSNYSIFFKKTYTFENLLTKYFNYGLFLHSSTLWNKFWYRPSNIFKGSTPLVYNKNILLYFRKFYYSHTTLTIEHSYYIRNKTPEFFPLRLYILRYNNWLVTSIQWFKPHKHTKLLNSKNLNSKNLIIPLKQHSILNKNLLRRNNRLKLLFFFLKSYNKFTTKTLQYGF